MKKLITYLIIFYSIFSGMSGFAQDYQASYNIIELEKSTIGTYRSCKYNGLILYGPISPITNIWWTGEEYIYKDPASNGLKKSVDMQNWEVLSLTDGLKILRSKDRTTFSIKHMGDKYIMMDGNYEHTGIFLEDIDHYGYAVCNVVWVLDEDFNILKTIEKEYPISTVSYVDGQYYMQMQNCDDYKKSGAINTIYTSEDALTWTVDETLTEVPQHDLSGFPLIFKGDFAENRGPYLRSITSVALSEISNRIPILYEATPAIYTKSLDDMYVSWEIWDHNAKSFNVSVDGVYWLEIPLPEFLLSSEVSDLPSIEYYAESVNYIIGLKDKILFQTQHRLFEYDKNELITAWYNAFGDTQTYVNYNDTLLGFETAPVIEDDRTLIPIRFLFEQMGADVTWNQDTQTATISQDNTAITFGIDDTKANVNGETVSMDIPARLINGKTMVPVRFLSEELGYTVDWDGENRIITIK